MTNEYNEHSFIKKKFKLLICIYILQVLYRAARLKPDALPRIFAGLPNDLSAPKPEARGSPGKRARRSCRKNASRQAC